MTGLRIGDVRRWMFDEALPFWATAGLDPDGHGFVEQLALDGGPAPAGFKRLRVQARQIYVYSHAHVMGWTGPAREIATRGVDFMTAHGWLPDGGWAKTLGERGGVLDPTLDLYDQAFAIHAFAWFHRAFGDADALRWAERTVEAVSRRLRREDGRGFWPVLPAGGEEQQNPHMHLLEAMMALFEATGERRYLAEAEAIATLMTGTFYDPGHTNAGRILQPRLDPAGAAARPHRRAGAPHGVGLAAQSLCPAYRPEVRRCHRRTLQSCLFLWRVEPVRPAVRCTARRRLGA